MAKEYSRTQRVADYLRRELAQLIQLEVRDPRVGMVTVNDVEVSRDMSHAKIFVTVMGKDSAEDAAASLEALNHAAGFLRTQISKQTQMRTTPKLHFVFDASIGRGAHLSALIDRARAEDRLHPGAEVSAAKPEGEQ